MPTPGTAVWSQDALQPFAPGVLTPFSFSVLAEMISRAWAAYGDRFGFTLAARSPILRRYQGRAYLNLSLPAQVEAEQAGIAPLALRVNGAPFALAAWEKPGFLGGLKLGRARKKRDEQTASLMQRMDAISRQAQAWHERTREVYWSQAEVLQVMEEIEHVGQEAMLAYLVAHWQRINLYAQAPALLDSDQDETAADEMTAALAAAGETGDLPDALLDRFGHRCEGEGEMATPRWHEDPSALARYLSASSRQVQETAKSPAPERKEAAQLLPQMHSLQQMQHRALDALAHIWAGTRCWALAAADEAMTDGRLHSAGEVFFFELEEIKRMMTGEWNVSAQAEIRDLLAQRQAEHAANLALHPADLLIGDQEAQPA